MNDRTLVPAKIPNGDVVVVPVLDLDGTAVSGEAPPPSLASAMQAVDDFSTRLHAALRTTAAPDTAKVEFSIGFAIEKGQIAALLVDGKTDGLVTVTMEWTNGQQRSDARPKKWWIRRRSTD